jgi:hypothetical protein
VNAPAGRNELLKSFESLVDGSITPSQHVRLEQQLAADSGVRRLYFDYLDMLLHLRQWQRAKAAAGKADGGMWMPETGMIASPFPLPSADLRLLDSDFPFTAPKLPLPVIVVDPSALSSTPVPLLSLGNLLFSYMVSAAILCVAILGAWAYKISHDYEKSSVVDRSHDEKSILQEPKYVGQITDMIGCRWADPKTQTTPGASVPLDRLYALEAGLMEITYKTGAKVVLQGPCTYKVDFENGGSLTFGKLTARIGKRGERKGEGAKPQTANLQISKSVNHQTPSPLSPPTSPFFAVLTPTAVVTDLGTEFGVSVDKTGESNVHVFDGKVELVVRSGGGASNTRRLVAGQMAHVSRAGIQPLVHSGLEPMAVMRERFQTTSFAQDFRLGAKGMVLLGNACLKGDNTTGYVTRLRLTDNSGKSQTGAAWRAVKQSAIDGFVAEFQFQFTSPSYPMYGGADGMAFVVQNTSQGSDLLVGHRGAADHALNVCVDSYQNKGEGDPSHASIVVRDGDKVLGRVDLNARFRISHLGNSVIHSVLISYVPGRLDVYFDRALVLTKTPFDLTALDRGGAVDANGKAWIGFGAATGDATENHNVLTWRFTPKTGRRSVEGTSKKISNSSDVPHGHPCRDDNEKQTELISADHIATIKP